MFNLTNRSFLFFIKKRARLMSHAVCLISVSCLLLCKRLPFRLQKVAFWRVKAYLLDGER